MFTRDFPLKLKALDDSGTIDGIISTYGPPADLVGDIMAKGAFDQAIAQQGKGFPLLFAHDQSQPLGLAKISDSAAGVIVNAKLVMTDPAVQRAYDHLKAGSIKGLSIGYTLPRGEGKVSYSDDGTRTLKEIRLHEISLVAVPANPRAQVTAVKSLDQIESVLRGYRPADVDADIKQHLRGIDAELRRLLRRKANGEDDECNCDCEQCLAGNCEDCSGDEKCAANIGKKAREAENLAALKAFAAELKKLSA